MGFESYAINPLATTAGQTGSMRPDNAGAPNAPSAAVNALQDSQNMLFASEDYIDVETDYNKHITKGEQFLNQYKYTAAIKEFEAALELKPGDEHVKSWLSHSYYLLGVFYIKNNRIGEAIDTFHQAIHMNWNDPILRLYLAEAHIQNNNYGFAFFQYGQAIALTTDEKKKKEYSETLKKAQRAFERILAEKKLDVKNYPESAYYYTSLGEHYCCGSMYAEAIPVLESAVRLDNYNPIANYELAYAYMRTHRYEKVLNLLNRPLTPRAINYAMLGTAYFRLSNENAGYLDEAIKAYSKALQCEDLRQHTNCTIGKIHFRMAQVYEAKGERELAQEHYFKAKQFGYKEDVPEW